MSKNQKLLTRFLSFLARQGVELSEYRYDAEGGAMFCLKPKEQRALVDKYLTKRRK